MAFGCRKTNGGSCRAHLLCATGIFLVYVACLEVRHRKTSLQRPGPARFWGAILSCPPSVDRFRTHSHKRGFCQMPALRPRRRNDAGTSCGGCRMSPQARRGWR